MIQTPSILHLSIVPISKIRSIRRKCQKKKKKYPPAAAEVAAASAGESRAAAWALARQARRWSLL